MVENLKNIMNKNLFNPNENNNIKNILMVALTCLFIYLILIRYGNKETSSNIGLEKMENVIAGNLSDMYSSGRLFNLINRLLQEKIINLKILNTLNSNPENKIQEFKLTQNTIPIGQISYFIKKIPENSWLLCDGRELEGRNYPELFRIINNRNPMFERETFRLPNLIGRVLNGRRDDRPNESSYDISPLSSGSPYMNKFNENYFTKLMNTQKNSIIKKNMSIGLAVNKIRARPGAVGIILGNRNTDGVNYCPPENQYEIDKSYPSYNSPSFKICKSNINMPPYMALHPYIKFKNLNFKFEFS